MLLMNKLTTQDDSQNKQFKPKIYQSKRRGQTRNFYSRHNYNQRIFKIGIDQILEIEYHAVVEYNMDRIIDSPSCNQNYRNAFRRGNFIENLRSNQNYRAQNYRGRYRRNYRNGNYEKCRIRSREREF